MSSRIQAPNFKLEEALPTTQALEDVRVASKITRKIDGDEPSGLDDVGHRDVNPLLSKINNSALPPLHHLANHFVTPISPTKCRYSVTHCNAGLFRWVYNAFQLDKGGQQQASTELQKCESKGQTRWEEGLALFLTYQEIVLSNAVGILA
jgi:hypothetical protein